MAPAPVVGIGGVLAPAQLADIAAAGAGAGCVVRGLREVGVEQWQRAWREGQARSGQGAVGWPHASLDG